jgi:hypothetical protein
VPIRSARFALLALAAAGCGSNAAREPVWPDAEVLVVPRMDAAAPDATQVAIDAGADVAVDAAAADAATADTGPAPDAAIAADAAPPDQAPRPALGLRVLGTFISPAGGSTLDDVVLADLDADGIVDVATSNTGSSCATVFRNHGAGMLESPLDYPTIPRAQQIALGDLNRDGKPDLAVGGRGTYLLINVGAGMFGNPDMVAGTGEPGVSAGDLNDDGKPDLVAGNGTALQFLAGKGDGTFAAPVNFAAPVRRTYLADVNGDKRLDALAHDGATTITVALGAGGGAFTSPALRYALPGAQIESLAAADLDGDGKLDLAVTSAAGMAVYVLAGRGDGTFAAAAAYDLGGGASGVAIADFDGDGRRDLALARPISAQVTVLLGRGDGTFDASRAAGFATAPQPHGLAAADLDGDGRPDIATANLSGSVTVLLDDGR